jgi:hypothetical protein
MDGGSTTFRLAGALTRPATVPRPWTNSGRQNDKNNNARIFKAFAYSVFGGN